MSASKTRPQPAAAESPGVRLPWLVAGGVLAIVGVVGAMMFSGAAVARPLLDPGAAVRWGLPLALAVHNVAVATVVGALVFAVVILPRDAAARRTGSSSHQHPAAPGAEHPAFSRVMTLASVAAVVWTIAAVAVLVLTYADVSGQSISGSSNYTASLIYFVSNFPTGQAWLAVTIFAAVVTTLCFGVRNLAALAVTLVLAMLGMMPQALIGHSSSSNDHEGAVNSLALHIAGVALWFGGIVALAVVSPKLGKLTGPVLKRFSTLALFGFVVVTASGVVNASIRVTSWHQLFTSAYGQLIMAKTVAVLVLGAIGYMHRQWIIPRLTRNTANTAGTAKATFSTRRVLWQLIAAEVLLMGVTSGIAVALSRSAPPEPTTFSPDATPAFILSGYELPPPLEFSRWFTEWRVDWLWLTFVLGTSVAYILGFIKLRRRGDSWPVIRMISWLVGMVALFYITSGGPSVYGLVLFSAHMVDHMALMVVAPLFMVMGAPISLALKALTPRRDGSRGVREWILAIVHSKFSAVVTHPLFAAANFAGSLVLFYYSPAFGYAMRDHVGHELMVLHFTITGYLFILTMIGVDPIPRRAPYPMRLLLLLATMAFHAFFGVSIMSSTTLLDASYFGNMGRTWGDSAIVDQQTGGAVAWGIGEVPTVLIALGVALMWSRSDDRESKRKDRAAERNNDADLNAYNDMFAQLAQREEPRRGGPSKESK